MSVTAKFKVSRVTDYQWGNPAAEVEFVPDYAQGRNAEWAAATPSGVIRMTVTNEGALQYFTLGRSFTVIFDPDDD